MQRKQKFDEGTVVGRQICWTTTLYSSIVLIVVGSFLSHHGRLFSLTLRNTKGDVLNHQEMHVLL